MKNKKWNWFDGLIILAVIAVVALGAMKLGAGKSGDAVAADTPSNTKEILLTFEAKFATDAMCEGFVIGEQLMAANKLVDATIVSVEVLPTPKASPDQNGVLQLYGDNYEKTAIIVVKANAVVSGPYYEVANQGAKVGSNFYLKTSTSELYGRVKKVEVL